MQTPSIHIKQNNNKKNTLQNINKQLTWLIFFFCSDLAGGWNRKGGPVHSDRILFVMQFYCIHFSYPSFEKQQP